LVWMLIPGAVPVEITAIPLGTTVKIKSTGQECVTPHCSIKLRPGKHDVEFSYPGYTTQTQTIPVQAKGPNKFALELESPGSPGTTKPHLAENRPPSPTIEASPTNKPPVTDVASMRIRGWNKGSEVFLDNNPIGTIGSAGTFSSITPGVHEIKVVDKKGDSGTMQKSFAPGERVNLAKKDFTVSVAIAASSSPPKPLPPLKAGEPDRWPQIANSGSTDQLEQYRAQNPNSPHLGELEATLDKLYWDKAMGAGSAVAFEEYLAKSPNGKHRDEAQENLTWRKTESTNTIQAFRDYQRQHPQGAHFESAGKKIDDLRFQEARNSGDEATLQAFLKDYPSGTRHDQIFGRLDNLIWEKTDKSDPASLQAYIGRTPLGRHTGEAMRDLDTLKPPPPPPSHSEIDEKRAVQNVLEQYRHAYEHKNVDELKTIWPGMTDSAASGLRKVFRDARSVKMTCNIVEGPAIDGDRAMVRFTQSLAITGQPQSAQQVVMTLKRVKSNWQIESLR
jgi:hypothetical protein